METFCHSSNSDSVELKTPLTTPIFDFHLVLSALTTPTPTSSLVKTSLSPKVIFLKLVIFRYGTQFLGRVDKMFSWRIKMRVPEQNPCHRVGLFYPSLKFSKRGVL